MVRLAVTVLLVLGACGGSDGDSGDATLRACNYFAAQTAASVADEIPEGEGGALLEELVRLSRDADATVRAAVDSLQAASEREDLGEELAAMMDITDACEAYRAG